MIHRKTLRFIMDSERSARKSTVSLSILVSSNYGTGPLLQCFLPRGLQLSPSSKDRKNKQRNILSCDLKVGDGNGCCEEGKLSYVA